MADVPNDRDYCDAERVVEAWIRELYLKRNELRRRKPNLRVDAILSNGIHKNRIILWKLERLRRQGEEEVGE
jgi:hypothetical protein